MWHLQARGVGLDHDSSHEQLPARLEAREDALAARPSHRQCSAPEQAAATANVPLSRPRQHRACLGRVVPGRQRVPALSPALATSPLAGSQEALVQWRWRRLEQKLRS